MNKLYKILFFSTLIIGTFITISSYRWIRIWIGLEINLLSIIPLINKNNNSLASESALKYFIIQTIASSTLLYILIISPIITNNIYFIKSYYIINTALYLKIGAAPLHFWFPEIIEGLDWFNSLLIITWQKIAPIILIINIPTNENLNYIFIIISILIGGIIGINQIRIRKILAYSSINHLGWILSILNTNQSLWINYFLIYSFISSRLILLLKAYNIYFITQFFSLKNNLLKLSILINFLSIGGIPPFLGFLPKWIIINELIKTNYNLSILIVLLTLLTLFIYLRTIIPTITLNTHENLNSINITSSTFLWIINYRNLIILILCTLWFNLT